ncbi:MAG: hypothetical protein LC722_00805 [Actinobacteria bacterium]|nr:hypothetical protein [Actinomycetota bacterium]
MRGHPQRLADAGLLLGLQDLGGAGITCAVSESASRADAGAELDLEAIPLREDTMEPFEILTSESQERMLAIVRPEDLDAVVAVCDRWGLASAVIGKVTTDRRLRVLRRGQVVVDVPAKSLADEGPVYQRPMELPAWLDDLQADDPTFADAPDSVGDAFLQLLGSPNIAGKRWVWEQYDRFVQHNTVTGPGGDAALIRLEDSLRAIAVSTDGNGKFAYLDPYLGAAHSVAEAARNVACVGAKPIAVTNCLNFGNPEKPEVMWQFAEAVKGLGEACRALGTPVTGGNVSFYNETEETAIHPTPVVGMLGVIEDYRLAVGSGFTEGRLALYLLGETFAELGGSEYASVVLGKVSGRPPSLDLHAERHLVRLLVDAARQDVVASAHDCSEGGLAIALTEAAIAGGTGFAMSLRGELPAHVELFSESASRAVLAIEPAKAEAFESLCGFHQVPFQRIGETGGPRLVFGDAFELPLTEAASIYESGLPNALNPQAATA